MLEEDSPPPGQPRATCNASSFRWLAEEPGVPVTAPASQLRHTMLDFAVVTKRADVVAYLRAKGGKAGYRPTE